MIFNTITKKMIMKDQMHINTTKMAGKMMIINIEIKVCFMNKINKSSFQLQIQLDIHFKDSSKFLQISKLSKNCK